MLVLISKDIKANQVQPEQVKPKRFPNKLHKKDGWYPKGNNFIVYLHDERPHVDGEREY